MRILIRISKWAIWARRFGSLAVPLAVIPIVLHRRQVIGSDDFARLEALAMAVAALALLLALGAFARLWVTGDRGWGKAVLGLVFSLLCLGPAAIGVAIALRYPPVTDITTDFARPPGVVSPIAPAAWSAADRAAVEAAYPNARNRTYPIAAPQVFALVAQLVAARGWELLAQREPQGATGEGQLNAIATTLLGWRDEVAIRITGGPAGTVVAARSLARHGLPDLGANGRRLEALLGELDDQITQLMRDAPPAPEPAPARPAAN